MKVQFSHAGFADTQSYVLRWYDQNGALVKTGSPQGTGSCAVLPVAPGAPARYELSGGFVEKPTPQPGVSYRVTVTPSNAAGPGPESTASAPFTMAAPVAATDVVVVAPLT